MSILQHPREAGLYALAQELSSTHTDRDEGLNQIAQGLRIDKQNEVDHWIEGTGQHINGKDLLDVLEGREDVPGIAQMFAAIHDIQILHSSWAGGLRKLHVRFRLPPPAYDSPAWPLIYSIVELADRAEINIATNFRPAENAGLGPQESDLIAQHLPSTMHWTISGMRSTEELFSPAESQTGDAPIQIQTIRDRAREYFEREKEEPNFATTRSQFKDPDGWAAIDLKLEWDESDAPF